MYAESFLRTMYISKTINSFILHPVLYGGCCFYPILLGSEPYFTLLKKKKNWNWSSACTVLYWVLLHNKDQTQECLYFNETHNLELRAYRNEKYEAKSVT